jgi:EamA domain-containing membrane protein RarD
MNRREIVVKKRKLTLSEIALIASTRGMLGTGIGLLLSSKLSKDQRRAVGWTLVAVGAITTIPLAINVFGQKGKARATTLRAA